MELYHAGSCVTLSCRQLADQISRGPGPFAAPSEGVQHHGTLSWRQLTDQISPGLSAYVRTS